MKKTNISPELVWEEILNELKHDAKEICTITKNGNRGVWFTFSIDESQIRIDTSIVHNPSAKLKRVRIINKQEFIKIAPMFELWRIGKLQRNIIRGFSQNSSYIFAILEYIYYENRRTIAST